MIPAQTKIKTEKTKRMVTRKKKHHPYFPNGIYHRLKRACEKAGVISVTRPGRKLKDISCGPYKTRHDPLEKPGTYRLAYTCSPKAQYISQTIPCSAARGKEHERAANSGNWSDWAISQHKETCPLAVNWKPEVIVNMTNQKKESSHMHCSFSSALQNHSFQNKRNEKIVANCCIEKN